MVYLTAFKLNVKIKAFFILFKGEYRNVIEEKYKQGVAENELFLFSILTGRIEVAKCWWKKGKVRPFISSINFNF